MNKYEEGSRQNSIDKARKIFMILWQYMFTKMELLFFSQIMASLSFTKMMESYDHKNFLLQMSYSTLLLNAYSTLIVPCTCMKYATLQNSMYTSWRLCIQMIMENLFMEKLRQYTSAECPQYTGNQVFSLGLTAVQFYCIFRFWTIQFYTLLTLYSGKR